MPFLPGFDERWKDIPDFILGITKDIWEDRGIHTLHRYYGPELVVRSPASVIKGNTGIIAATEATLAEFPDRQLLGEDVMWCATVTTVSCLRTASIVQRHMKDLAFTARRRGANSPTASLPIAGAATTECVTSGWCAIRGRLSARWVWMWPTGPATSLRVKVGLKRASSQ